MSPSVDFVLPPNPSGSSAKGIALVVGTLSTAQDGKYQSLIKELEVNRKVDREMLDRLIDGGTC
jgi:anamorsin